MNDSSGLFLLIISAKKNDGKKLCGLNLTIFRQGSFPLDFKLKNHTIFKIENIIFIFFQ